jgi:hypothetical protein
MNKLRSILTSLLVLLTISLVADSAATSVLAQPSSYDLSFSTYLGGSDYDSIRDVATDNRGNIYVTGGTESVNFPTTIGPSFNSGFCPTIGSFGAMDIFITKYSPTGQRIWSRLLGGPCYDRAYAIEVDGNENVYLGGRAGESFPVTANAFQAQFMGVVGLSLGAYGAQDGFVAKISPDGSQIIFASYFGSTDHDALRDIDITENGELYAIGMEQAGIGTFTTYVQSKFTNSHSGGSDAFVFKISADASQLIWARHIGGSGSDGGGPSIRVNSNGEAYGLIVTASDGISTPGVFQAIRGGGNDLFLAKIKSDGTGLVFGSYLGGSELEAGGTHNLELDSQGNAYVHATTYSPDLNKYASFNAIQPTFAGGLAGGPWDQTGDKFIAKISSDGTQILDFTFLGGRYGEVNEGTAVDSSGNIYMSGGTFSDNFPLTNDAYKSSYTYNGQPDATAAILSNDFSQPLYSSYFGTSGGDGFRAVATDLNNNLILGGETASSSWPLLNAYQSSFGGGNQDAVVIKFSSQTSPSPTPTSIQPSPTPSPSTPPGDCSVNGTDYVNWLVNYGRECPNILCPAGSLETSDGDYFDDDQVNGVDYVVWLNNYGT